MSTIAELAHELQYLGIKATRLASGQFEFVSPNGMRVSLRPTSERVGEMLRYNIYRALRTEGSFR